MHMDLVHLSNQTDHKHCDTSLVFPRAFFSIKLFFGAFPPVPLRGDRLVRAIHTS